MPDALFKVLEIALYLFEGFCMQHLFSAFAEPKIRDGRIGGYGAIPDWVIIRVCAGLLFAGSASESMVWKLLCAMLLLSLFSVSWYRGTIRSRIFPAIQFTAVRELTFFAAYSFMYVGERMNGLAIRMFEEGAMTLRGLEAAVCAAAILSILLMEALRCGLLLLAVRKIAGSYRYRSGLDKEIGYYLLPAAAGILIAVLLRLLMVTVEDGDPILLYGRYPALYLIIPMIAIALLGMIVFSVPLYQDMAALERERAERAVMENQIVQMQNSLAEVEHFYDGVRAIRHDMKNHMAVLQNLLRKNLTDSGADGELRQYFEDMDAAVGQLAGRACTGNAVCDAVISSKFLYAEKEIKGIALDADGFVMSDRTGMRAYDVGIILSNGLDNAIEACRKLRENQPDARAFIEVRSFWNGKMYFIEIENSFDGRLRMDGESGFLLSAKKDGGAHGIGLRNIRSCAQKYAGDMDWIIKGDRFVLSVMIKES